MEISASVAYYQRDRSYRTARGGAAERGVVRTSRTRVGLRRGWLVAMMCAVGDGCGVDGGVALEKVEGVAWATATVVDCAFFAAGGVAARLLFWAERGCGKKPWLWSVAVAKAGTGRGGVALATCAAALALAARAVWASCSLKRGSSRKKVLPCR